MSKMNLLVMFGGRSPEYEVSLVSASSVLKNINSEKYNVIKLGITKKGVWFITQANEAEIKDGSWERSPLNRPAFLSPDSELKSLVIINKDGTVGTVSIDVIFPVIHGEQGEDGTLQGLFELALIPYVGCDTRSSANCLDKATTKLILDSAGIKQAGYIAAKISDYQTSPDIIVEESEKRFGYPIFVKPSGTGSSVGVSKAKDRASLIKALDEAFLYDSCVLIEEFIDGHEIECAVLGNENPEASVCGEVVPANEFYDYEAKYRSDDSLLYIPARIPDETASALRETAVKAFKAAGCSGLSRIDFFVAKKTGEIILNEINTMPGFTSISLYPKLFEKAGISYSALIERLIELAVDRAEKRNKKI